MRSVFSGVRIVEIGELEAMSYCGKLFADFGADVVKLEPAGGDRLRAAWPRDPESGESGLFAWLNAGKSSVELKSDSELEAWLRGADVLLDTRSTKGAAERRRALRAAFPNLTVLSLSWFGETGPYADFEGSDAVCRALAGLVKMIGPVEGPPRSLPDHQASVHAGLTAFSAAVASLQSDGGARGFELSVFEASVILQEFPAAAARFGGASDVRMGLNRYPSMFPMGVFACRDGLLGVSVGRVQQWWSFCEMLGFDDWGADASLELRQARQARSDEMDQRIAARLDAFRLDAAALQPDPA